MPTAVIGLLISIIPMIPQVTAEAVSFVRMVRDLINGAPDADQAHLNAQWDAMRSKVTAADEAWQNAGI